MTESSLNRWPRPARPDRNEAAGRSYKHPNPRMLAEVVAGLSAPHKELPPKYFYDHRGSELFEEITGLPEYYQTRTERAILEAWMPELIPQLGTRALIELGAGSAEKTRLIISAMRDAGTADLYVPIDVSASFLNQTAAGLLRDYPGLAVESVVSDITEEFNRPPGLPHPAMYVFLGGTIGNFYPPAAIKLLSRVRVAMDSEDRLLLGVDLRKDVGRIERAYNDSRGVTAAFNRNMLLVLNHQLGANFDPELFEHRAFYEPVNHRIEMYLISTVQHEVRIPGIGLVPFAKGEPIRTEISCKHDRESVTELFESAGLRIKTWRPDPDALFALVLGVAA